MSSIRETIAQHLPYGPNDAIPAEQVTVIEEVTRALELREVRIAAEIRKIAGEAGLDPAQVESALIEAVALAGGART